MFTANSMNCLGEVLGFALPGNGSITATRRIKGKIRQMEIEIVALKKEKDRRN